MIFKSFSLVFILDFKPDKCSTKALAWLHGNKSIDYFFATIGGREDEIITVGWIRHLIAWEILNSFIRHMAGDISFTVFLNKTNILSIYWSSLLILELI